MAAAIGVGAGISAVGTLAQGSAAEKAGQYNAAMADYNASAAQNDGLVRLQQQETRSDTQIGNEKAQYGASGVASGSGSALAMLKQSASQAALDAVNIQNTTAAKVYGYQQSANLDIMEGEAAQSASEFSAAGQIVSGYGEYKKAGG